MDYGVAPDYIHSDALRERSLLYLRLRWANLLALVVISLFGSSGVFTQSNRLIILYIMGFSAILNLFLYAYIKVGKKRNQRVGFFVHLAFAQMIFDYIVIGFVAYLSGNPPNQYALVYVMPIFISSALFSRGYLYITATVGSLCYLASNYPNVRSVHSDASMTGDNLIVSLMYVLVLFILAYLADILFAEKHKKEVESAQSEMISLVSHQLRTPASAVKGFLSFLLEDYGGPLQPKQREFIEKANDENDIQIKLIDNILNVAKIDLRRVKLNPVVYSFKTLVEDVMNEYRTTFSSRDQDVAFSCHEKDTLVKMDPQLMRMVVDNVISNASKYSGNKGKINISLTGDKKTISLHIEDNGLGIPQGEQNKLFKRFYRVLAKVEGQYIEGSGLGLYLAKRLVELHHGTISLVSYPGEGTLFTITLRRE